MSPALAGVSPPSKPKQRGFAGARTADNRQELAAENVEGNRFEDAAKAAGKLHPIVEITTLKNGFLTRQRSALSQLTQA